jgi:hypothetical protein
MYHNISAITISGINVLENPILFKNFKDDNKNIISKITFAKGQEEGKFVINIDSDYSDL